LVRGARLALRPVVVGRRPLRHLACT
jgi:hypothetical protein